MAEYTKGRWQYSYIRGEFDLDGINVKGILITSKPPKESKYKRQKDIALSWALDSGERKANAQLISAAPDMYEAIKKAIHEAILGNHVEITPELKEMFFKAIEQAEGRKE